MCCVVFRYLVAAVCVACFALSCCMYRYVGLCCVVLLWHVVLLHIGLGCGVLCCSVCCRMLCCVVLCCVVSFSGMQFCVVLCRV